MVKLRQLSSLLVRPSASFRRPTGQIPAASTTAFNHCKLLQTLQKESASKAQRLTPEPLMKHNLTRYHYIRPIIQGTVASATIFTAAGLAHIFEDNANKKDSVNKMTECSLIAMNALVLGCWRLKSLRRFMETHFMHHVGSGRCPVQELSNRHEIVAIYLSSGIFGSAASHAYRLAQYRVFKQKLAPNLGASGALLGIMAVAYSWLDPETHEAKIGIYKEVFVSQIVTDLTAMICGIGIIDHAAHVGGALFGALYSVYGREYVWNPLLAILRKLLNKE